MESKLKASEDHYTYVNMEQLMWDEALSFWKPRGAIGDRYAIWLKSHIPVNFIFTI